jgi:hypothetical protein
MESIAIMFIDGLTGGLDVPYITRILKLEGYLLGYLFHFSLSVAKKV